MSKKVEDILSDVYRDFFGTKASTTREPNRMDNIDPKQIAKEAQQIRVNIENEFQLEKQKERKENPGSSKKIDKKPNISPMEELNSLIGLDQLKDDVKELINLVKMQKLREEKGLKTVPVSLHLVFTGNPGTGKTTIARILASLYKEIGVLSKGQLVEVDRSALVAGFVGQTATKTQEKLKEAMGGVLFIDEAYTLVKEGGNDFGQEAIDTILKSMEDHRDDLIVIVAGYPDLMEKFINSNPGLKSRFNKYFYFPDYSADELSKIFYMYCKKYDYKLSKTAEIAIEQSIIEMVVEKDENFANARSVRNMFETIITNQASRVAKIDNPNEEDVVTIEIYDIDGYTENSEKSEEVINEIKSENIENSVIEPTDEKQVDSDDSLQKVKNESE